MPIIQKEATENYNQLLQASLLKPEDRRRYLASLDKSLLPKEYLLETSEGAVIVDHPLQTKSHKGPLFISRERGTATVDVMLRHPFPTLYCRDTKGTNRGRLKGRPRQYAMIDRRTGEARYLDNIREVMNGLDIQQYECQEAVVDRIIEAGWAKPNNVRHTDRLRPEYIELIGDGLYFGATIEVEYKGVFLRASGFFHDYFPELMSRLNISTYRNQH
jgi:hypothetical protein